MSLSLKEVEHIARLARLNLTDEQKALYRGQLEAILNHVAQLQELDTSDVSPTTSIAPKGMPLREDMPRESLNLEDLLRNASQDNDGQFKIPSVFE